MVDAPKWGDEESMDRAVKINLVRFDGKERSIDPKQDTVTMYVKTEKQEIIVLPDVSGFRVHVSKPQDGINFVAVEVGDDGELRIGWNTGNGKFRVRMDELNRVVVMPELEKFAGGRS